MRLRNGIRWLGIMLCAVLLNLGPASGAVIEAQTLEYPAPADFSLHHCEDEACFWQLPMGDLDEEAIWEVMMQPVTVLTGNQRQIVKLYEAPNEKSRPVGEVTCESQALHVLETTEDGWALVEVYSSSASKSVVRVFSDQVQGYIKTAKFKEKKPDPTYGLLLDKLKQRLYIFKEGKIITELLVSTGLPNAQDPFNETPAGEFLIVSRSGGFWSGNMYCDMGLRINAGILIHEVPCLINAENQRYYAPFEAALGRKASHGCVRVQQAPNEQGYNMRWIWDNVKVNTKVLIWDDVGRPIPLPDVDMPVYFNPSGGKYYHLDQDCPSVSSRFRPLTPARYGDLDTEHPEKTPCHRCRPPQKLSVIEAENR